MTYIIHTYKYFYRHTYILNGSFYKRLCVYIHIHVFDMFISVRIFIYLYVYNVHCASSLWYIYIIYIVFIRTLSFTLTSALLLTNRSAISVRPLTAANIRAVSPHYIYIYIRTKTYDIDIVKEVSIHNTSYTIINI